MKIIKVEQYNVNDDEIKVNKIIKKNLAFVDYKDILFEIETSKANIEIESSTKGYLVNVVKKNDRIKTGDKIAFIFDNLNEAKKFEKKNMVKKSDIVSTNTDFSKFTAKAKKKIKELQLNKNDLINKNIFSEKEIIKFYNKFNKRKINKSLPSNNDYETTEINNIKSSEIKNLNYSKLNYLPCVCSINIHKFDIVKFAKKNSLYFNNISPLIAKICSKLLINYKNLNGFFSNNKINLYKNINIGFTMENEKGLRVLVIQNTNNLSFKKIQKKYLNLVDKNIRNQIDINDIKNLTFSISDLSQTSDIAFHIPLIAPYTSAILGIAIDKTSKILNLTLSYDHQLSSGLESLNFLKDIKDEISKRI